MDHYYEIELTRKVSTRKFKAGSDFAVCRATSMATAVSQLLPEMRDHVRTVQQRDTMRACYPHPDGILRKDAL